MSTRQRKPSRQQHQRAVMRMTSVLSERENYAAVMRAQTKPSKEECALSMGQRSIDAAAMDAQTMPSGGVYRRHGA
eukprot:scaffold7106_cov183-Skeletonema_menzelii.AAC.2